MHRFFIVYIVLLISFSTLAQSKKQQIRLLSHKNDSLISTVSFKDKEIEMLKKEIEQCMILHSEDMRLLNEKITQLETELLHSKNNKNGKKSKKAKESIATKELKTELATTKKTLDSLMHTDSYFKTGKSIILKNSNRPIIEVVDIQGGTFLMGSPENEKMRGSDEGQHKVTLSDFKISKYEVTFDMYDAYCDSVGLPKPDDNGWGRGNRPVVNITWREANNFAIWMGGRLPTEAEWEYAARAGGRFAFGKSNCLSKKQAVFDGISEVMRCGEEFKMDQTSPVGSFEPNGYGLHDMFGNVFEWCSDWYGVYPQGTTVDPEGPVSGGNKVNRGGSWANSAVACRVASRESSSIDFKGNRIGFRLVFSR
jgi:formylglycine-generating enzyme required for sulfatase activity